MRKIYEINVKQHPVGTQIFHGDKLFNSIVEGCYVYLEPADIYLHSNGVVLAAATILQFEGKNFPTVLTDSKYATMPMFLQEFVLYHEFGHIVNGDLDLLTEKTAKQIMYMRSRGEIHRIEYAADLYAAKAIGFKKTIKALKLMAYHSDLPKVSRLEVHKRLMRIRKEALLSIFA